MILSSRALFLLFTTKRRWWWDSMSRKITKESRGYRFLEHMTDAEIEAYGSTLEEAFENAAKALEDTMVDIATIEPLHEENIKVEGTDKYELLYEWLESLIVKQETEGMLYSRFECKIFSKTNQKENQNNNNNNESSLSNVNHFYLEARAAGEKFDPRKHEQKTAIKAPTYHDMTIYQQNSQVTLKFLLDL